MVSTSYIIGIAKIVDEPKFEILDNNTYFTTCKAELEQSKNISLNFWGNLAHDIIEDCQIDDYILVEGHISLQENEIPIDSILSKKVILTVLKVHLIY